MTITASTTATGRSLSELATAIAAAITAGKQPFGNQYFDGRLYCQPMITGSPASVATFEETEIDVHVPLTGDTITLAPDAYLFAAAINPSATIAALTLNIAAGTRNGQRCRVSFLHIVTTLTNGANLAGDNRALATSAAVGDVHEYIWSISKAKWERM